ncbi:hypothetical protein K3728_04330 [Rhodobacteraceae bacterium M385]|nr:hypothetical protein K3728_04330 [Rhodobacteraceae bacterium M385]
MVNTAASITINERTAEIFGPLFEGRDCSKCSACCTHMNVVSDDYSKPAGQPCAHLCAAGCGIYQTRFPVCHKWYCLWRHIEALPDEARPDRLGAILTFSEPPEPSHLFRRAFVNAILFDKACASAGPLFDEVLAMFAEGDLPAWVSDGPTSVLSYPHPDVAACAMGQPNADVAVRVEAARWTTGLRT